MRNAITVTLAIMLLYPVAAQSGKKIVILHTNDMHSRLAGYAPESAYSPLTVNDDKTVGGFARIASIIKSEKDKNQGVTLVVDAGDFLMGTLFQGIETNTGFQLRLMKSMGYEVACLGNHEFDYGPEKLAEIINSSINQGEIPQLLLSNAVFDDADTKDDALGKLFSDGVIGTKTILNKDGLKIGMFSLLGKVADGNAAYAPPVTFARQIQVARKMVKELKDEGCNIIICLSHSGVTFGKNGDWAGEDVKLSQKVKGMDAIISGHTHTKLEKAIMVNGIPVVQAGDYGRYVGKLVLTYDNGIVKFDEYSLLPVNDRISGDHAVHKLIEDQKRMIDEEILKPLGMVYDRKVVETDFILGCDEMGDITESNLGPLVADAIHSYVNNHVSSGTDISLVAVGVIRDSIVPGFQAAPDIFRIMSMGAGKDNVPGYPLAQVFVTGRELKSILEILQVAYKSTPANYCYYSGLKVEFNPEKGMLRKIRKIEIVRPDGSVKEVDFSKKNKDLYSIAANSYILEFVGIIKKMSFGLINVVPKDARGNPISSLILDFDERKEGLQEGKEWLALMEYLTSMKDVNGNKIPDIDKKYKVPVKNFFPVTDIP